MLVIAIRAAVLFITVYLAMRIMGKRELGQLQPFEFVMAILMADLVTVPMDDSGTPLLYGLVPIMAMLIIHLGLTFLSLKFPKARRMIQGRPMLVVAHGRIMRDQMAQLRLNVDDLTEQMRLNGYFSIADVEYAILETGGGMSIMPKAGKSPATADDLQLTLPEVTMTYTLVADGSLYRHNLSPLCLTEDTLIKLLKKQGYNSFAEVFFASMSGDGRLFIQGYEKEGA